MGKYHMNRKEREIRDQNELNELLRQGKYAVISMCRDNEPYIVTLNYGYDKDKNALYFHTAQKGLKFAFIKYNSNVCATIIEDNGYIINDCDHKYRSVVFWGKMSVVEDLEEKKRGIEVLLNHLENDPKIIREKILRSEDKLQGAAILRLDIKELTGKKNPINK
jgi:nitroimidazol reductase NimA-like FMN-containing flavoprotein (pyridoxamine 5'-phosphate oxidase superfamily)